MADTRSAREIESEIEQDRAALDQTIAELRGRLTFDNVGRQITDQVRTNGGEIATAVSRSVKENPIALGLAGVGLAWMIFGSGPSSTQISRGASRSRRAVADRFDRSGGDEDESEFYASTSAYDPPSRYETPGSNASAAAGIRGPRPAAPPPVWARGRPHDTYSDADSHLDDPYVGLPAPVQPVGSAEGSATSGSDGPGIGERMSASASSAYSSASDGYARAGASARHAVEGVRSSADRARLRIAAGTEKLSEDARERVIAARLRALEIRDEADAAMRRGGAVAADYYDRQPLVFGALAVALGAAIGAGLPHTRQEDEWLGATRDRLVDDAEQMFQSELSKAQRVAGAVTDEAQKMAEEAKGEADRRTPGDKDAANSMADAAEGAANRLRDRAVDEAEKQDLGNPDTTRT
ncbi:uncharacterized protein DUF3618 [Palleronia aestuarii]|uniref:Uncharacterized protein DUF3618 n=1 Tax=Palleronia aestuarii TaxID=568105 RepID=A0A2W7N866_9RHOB|nr:DUF3618 domain-containing protein [Palleronia aestuarii]PZX16220.1 uncharacterized protein DUF3618 [Palleronia aestuarii]